MALGSVETGQSVTTNITIGNTGNDTLTWTDVSTGSAAVTTDTPSGSLPAKPSDENYAGVRMYFTFTPTTAGTYNGTITVTSDATGGTNTIAYTGTGT